MPMAVKEMVMARSLGQIDASTFKKMLQTACSKLCALPVCVVTWLLSYRYVMSRSKAFFILRIILCLDNVLQCSSIHDRADSPSTRAAIERTTDELLDIVYRKNNLLPQSLSGEEFDDQT